MNDVGMRGNLVNFMEQIMEHVNKCLMKYGEKRKKGNYKNKKQRRKTMLTRTGKKRKDNYKNRRDGEKNQCREEKERERCEGMIQSFVMHRRTPQKGNDV